MAYISKSKGREIGDWVVTKKRHESFSGVFTIGSRVKIIEIDSIRGYSVEDSDGNKMYEIGWEI